VPADVTYVDLPAPPSLTEGGPPVEIPADQLARLRNADALLHVVRAFEDPSVPHPLGGVDPWRDIEQLELELTVADLGVVEKRVDKLRTSGRHGTPAEREANERELEVLERILPALTDGTPIRDLELSDDESKRVRGFRFLTEKPELILLNVGEGQIADEGKVVDEAQGRVKHRQTMVEALSAKIEMEIGELEADEAAVFREELGLAESSLERVIRLSYELLGLISFFTAGPDETRAWTIHDGDTAVDAAAAIHTDIARGFIRAETVSVADLLELGSTAEARKRGKLRSEGKTYLVRDGDVIEILHSS
jgi:GTP-binding protein YchF